MDDIQGPRVAISNALVRQLKTITNADGANWFDGGTIYEYPNFSPAGYPSAIVIPANVASQFDNQVANRRNYEFFILLLEQADTKTLDSSYNTMRQLEDDVIDVIDRDYDLGGLASELGSNYTLIDTMAVPSAWERVTVANVDLLVTEIRVMVQVQFDIS